MSDPKAIEALAGREAMHRLMRHGGDWRTCSGCRLYVAELDRAGYAIVSRSTLDEKRRAIHAAASLVVFRHHEDLTSYSVCDVCHALLHLVDDESEFAALASLATPEEASRETAEAERTIRDALKMIPLGLYGGANRYDTDNEHVLHLWTAGRSVDVQAPREVSHAD